MTDVPEAEPLEQHADAFAPFRNVVQAPVQLEILEGCELAVDERLVSDEPDPAAFRANLELAGARRSEPSAQPQERRLPRAVRTGDEEERVARKLEVDPAEHPFVPVTLLQPASPDHNATVVSRGTSGPGYARAMMTFRGAKLALTDSGVGGEQSRR
jgi:hypothetical protein